MDIHRYRIRSHRILLFRQRLLRTGRYPDKFSRTDRQNIGIQTPRLASDIIIITKGTVEKHEAEVRETLKKLEDPGYTLHPKKSEFFKKRTRLSWTPNKSERNQTPTRQTGSNNKSKYTKT